MENLNTIDGQNDENMSIKEKRGTFLLVLCILTWVNSGFGLFGVATSFSNGEAGLNQQIELIEDTKTGNEFLDNIIEGSLETLIVTVENFQMYHLGNAVVFLLGILAAYLMFNLKKIGYFIYIVYSFAAVGFYYSIFGEVNGATYSMTWMGLMSITFIILYGVNLKRMTE